jgi:hypothetical protein
MELRHVKDALKDPRVAGGKAGGALSETLNTMQNMNNPTIKPLPNQTPIQGTSIEDRMKRYNK